MKTRDKIIFSLLALVAFGWLISMIKSILTPFISSLIIAYFLDPLVDYLCKKHKLSRLTATSLIMGLFLAFIISTSAILLPIIYIQTHALISSLPGYLEIFISDFYPAIADALNHLGFKLDTNFSHLTENSEIANQLLGLSSNVLSGAASSSVTIINILSLIFITPILVFYLLKDWDILVGKINDLLPKKFSSSLKKLASDIDKTLAGYIRGQFNVCLILGIIYSSLLSFTGLNFGFLIGFLTGIFSFIPYVGMLCGVGFAVAVGLFQWGFDLTHISLVALVFIFGQIIESNFLTPKLIGKKIGLHPVWIIFGLFVFGSLFGFVGILIGVPLTAICGVVIKHLAASYKQKFT